LTYGKAIRCGAEGLLPFSMRRAPNQAAKNMATKKATFAKDSSASLGIEAKLL
jgi:hypothetical protein